MEGPAVENLVTIVDTQEGAAKLIAESSLTLAEAFFDTLKHQVECEFVVITRVCIELVRAPRPHAPPSVRSLDRGAAGAGQGDAPHREPVQRGEGQPV